MKPLKQCLLIGMNLGLLAVVLSPLAGTTGQWVTLGLGLAVSAALFAVYRHVGQLERSQNHAD
ncbi:hypothetical protein D1831_13310 [Lactiplantibacillus garii]|uniref:Uncharacterized protein n=1 Tax=Lactiplantibacillus garii TaxID=2306423 RepID=A0A3R8LI95_9LACO|nr:hypothetical protein [Lactiplantibacillus garii]RRK09335.1 hypothetical protein D1831_13310 [Lactiplantibacillus garii]